MAEMAVDAEGGHEPGIEPAHACTARLSCARGWLLCDWGGRTFRLSSCQLSASSESNIFCRMVCRVSASNTRTCEDDLRARFDRCTTSAMTLAAELAARGPTTGEAAALRVIFLSFRGSDFCSDLEPLQPVLRSRAGLSYLHARAGV